MSSDIPRAYTEEEIRQKFLEHVWVLVDYWESQKEGKRDALEGLAFSILSTLDGSSLDIPAFLVIPSPHPDDQAYCESQGENWFPPFVAGEEPCDIGGSLHELFYSVRQKNEKPRPK